MYRDGAYLGSQRVSSGIKPAGNFPEIFTYKPDQKLHAGKIQKISFSDFNLGSCWRDVRPIPETDDFFENQWSKYREKYGVE